MKATLTPHITEKSYNAIELTNKEGAAYTFKVPVALNKDQIKTIVEREFKVTVASVNIVRLPGKVRRFKGIPGKTSITKKAIVRVKKGDKIAAFDIEDKSAKDKK